ncbi:PITH domain-containing protein [Rhodotorula paludigena]|uniref:PITH domain-containing protein n=1 Tax=Rhodotorula paludigena TaxID=86838 RepID=UPI00317BC8D8
MSHPPGCSCGDEDAHVLLEGTLNFLYQHVDRDKVVALNAEEGKEGKVVIRPWDQRQQEDEWLESDADEQLILHIPFTGNVKLRSILVKTGPAGYTPDKMLVFANQLLDFDEATSQDVTQNFDVAATKEVVEYAVRPAKFPSVRSLTLFFPSNHGEDTTRVSFVGFKGEYSALTRDPIITVYEAQANPADHAKIPGLDSTAHSRIG